MRTVLVTGGAGFIGSAVVRQLLRSGIRVVNLDRLTYARNTAPLRSIADSTDHRFVQGDIADVSLVVGLLRSERVTGIVHLAAETHGDRSADALPSFIETGAVGTFRLLMATLEYWRELPPAERQTFGFHHVSTDEVSGGFPSDGGIPPADRHAAVTPAGPGASSDHLARAWHETYGVPVILSHCSNNYGPYQFPEKFIPRTILDALENKPLPIWGTEANVRDWLYVEDHARALELVLTSGRVGETYDIGAGEARSYLAVVEAICDAIDQRRPGRHPRRTLISFVSDRRGRDRHRAIDTSRLMHELGWRPRETFETGLDRTVDWYLDNRWWWESIRLTRMAKELGLTPAGNSHDASDNS